MSYQIHTETHPAGFTPISLVVKFMDEDSARVFIRLCEWARILSRKRNRNGRSGAIGDMAVELQNNLIDLLDQS